MPVKFRHTITNMKVTSEELTKLKCWLQEIDQYMVNSVSTYAKGRRELQLRHSVTLAKNSAKKEAHKVVAIDEATSNKYNSGLIESIGERLLPGFHQALVLHYPKGTSIKVHRDSPAYDKGAATVNIIGKAKLLISDNQDATDMKAFDLGEGDCINFDNKQPHAIAKVEEDRWCVCFFYIKDEFLPKEIEQMGLFSNTELFAQSYQYVEETSDKKVKTSTRSLTSIAYQKYESKERIAYPRYSWKDNRFGWWNPTGEEISYIQNLTTKERRTGVKDADDIPDGWGAVLDYGGEIILREDLRLISLCSSSQ